MTTIHPDSDAPRIEGFIVLTRDQRWGWGVSIDDAKRTAKRAGAGSIAKGNRAVYRLPVGAVNAHVDQMGQINWTWADDAPDRTALGDWLEKPER